jgi:hypothetical protein
VNRDHGANQSTAATSSTTPDQSQVPGDGEAATQDSIGGRDNQVTVVWQPQNCVEMKKTARKIEADRRTITMAFNIPWIRGDEIGVPPEADLALPVNTQISSDNAHQPMVP